MDKDTVIQITELRNHIFNLTQVIEKINDYLGQSLEREKALEGRILALEQLAQPYIQQLEPKDLKGKKIPHLKIVQTEPITGDKPQ